MKTPHKHAEIIKAWADGDKVEYWDVGEKCWLDIDTPSWAKSNEYRIKPEPKPDFVSYGVAMMEAGIVRVFCLGPENARDDNNITLTFDGETGKLKAAEVLK